MLWKTHMNNVNINFQMVTSTLREVRSNQPKVTLHEAQQQAVRVMEAARRSPYRLRHSSNGVKKTT